MANYSVYILAPTLLSLNFDIPKLGTWYVLYGGMKHTFQVRMIEKSQDMNTVSGTYVNISTNSHAKGTRECYKQSQIEIEYYSVPFFEHITEFDVL